MSRRLQPGTSTKQYPERSLLSSRRAVTCPPTKNPTSTCRSSRNFSASAEDQTTCRSAQWKYSHLNARAATSNTDMSDKWKAADIPLLTGKRVIITGANSGIGYHAALKLARKSAQVV